MDIQQAVSSLVAYGLKNGLLEEADRIYTVNLLLERLGLDSYESAPPLDADLEQILKAILDYACANGLCQDSVTYRDLFDTKIMNCLLPRPSQVRKAFFDRYAQSPQMATDWYYAFSRATDYIRTYRVKNDRKWVTKTEYGDIDITINLSKPEKDPKAIAAAANMAKSSYPLCMLCPENEGYAGRVNHPARENHRVIPVTIDGGHWFMQYSPYVYYNEHCIVFNGSHVPMKIDRSAFRKLFDFVRQFPHYFIGSNADLPIVGGSILSHEHFQGGRYAFAMEKAPVQQEVSFPGYQSVKAGIVKWPMSVLRLTGDNPDDIVDLADRILTSWRGYTDEEAFIFAETDGTPHNTITPIARRRGEQYELDLVLRNNITTKEYPDGVYHPHPEHHHIKKENIGLIEVMGLAVLPARLKQEMAVLADAMVSGKDIASDERIGKHAVWAADIAARREVTAENVHAVLQDEIGKVFADILAQCGVFARTEQGMAQFLRFIQQVS